MIKLIQLFEDGDFQRKLQNATRNDKKYLSQMVNAGVYFETHTIRRHHSIYLINAETIEFYSDQMYELSIQNNVIYVYSNEAELHDESIHDIADQFIMSDFSIVKLHASLSIATRNMVSESEAHLNPIFPGKLINRASNSFNTLFNSMETGIFGKDLKLKYRAANQRFLTDFGVSNIDDLLGKTDDEINRSASAIEFSAFDLEVIQKGESVCDIEKEVMLANGKKEWLRISKFPLIDRFGKTSGIIGKYEIITSLKLVEQSTRKNEISFQTFFENSGQIMAFKDVDGKYEQVNQTFLKLLKLEGLSEIVGKTDFEILENESARVIYSLEQQLILERKTITMEESIYLLKTGETQHCKISRIPIFDDLNIPLGIILIGAAC